MTLDPRTPVLIGHGQVDHRDDDAPAPVALMEQAVRRAAPAAVLAAVDTVTVVHVMCWPYTNPGALLADLIGAPQARSRYGHIGGNTPQSMVNQACLDIAAGRAEVVVIAGAECWRTATRYRAGGAAPPWPVEPAGAAAAEPAGADQPLGEPCDSRLGLYAPAQVYPLFEQSLRIAAGRGSDEHRAGLGELWSRFSGVAAQNPHAWSRAQRRAEEIWQAGPDNRMISWPYPKLMTANNMVDQGAALVVASAGRAAELGVPTDQWVFPYAGADAHDTDAIAERAQLHRSPAIRIAGRRALELSGVGLDDVDLLDVYSCFPSAVQVAATELGLALDDHRGLTVTGGLTFFGGPWSNYVTHSIATMAEKLTAKPGALGLITANGGYLTKHSFGVYGTTPPAARFRWQDVQDEVDREPTVRTAVDWQGRGCVESWTVPFDRAGEPERAYVLVRTPAGERTMAAIDDATQVRAAVDVDIAGAAVDVHPDSSATLV